MNNLKDLIVLLEKEIRYTSNDKIKNLELASEKLNSPMNYTKESIENLNEILIDEVRLTEDELDRIRNFAKLSDTAKKYYLHDAYSEEDKVLYSIPERINKSKEFYQSKKIGEINVKKLKRKLTGKLNELINEDEINIINNCLKKNNISGKNIWKEIHKINFNIFKNYNINTQELGTIVLEETNVDEKELVKLLASYGINFSEFTKNDKSTLLLYADLGKIDELLKFLQDENALTTKLTKYTGILTLMFIRTSLQDLINLKESTIGIDFKDLVSIFPTALYPNVRTYSRKKIIGSEFIQTQESGLLTTIQKNAQLMNENGIDIQYVWDECPSFLKQSNSANKDNIAGLKSYGISLLDENGKPKKMLSVLGNRNPSMIDIYDTALEADAKEYALNNLSSLAPSTRYKFNLIKAAKALGMPDSDIFRGYRAPNRELSLNLKKLSLNPHLSTDIDKQNELYGKVNIEIPNFRVYDNLFDIVNPINVSEEVLDDKNIKAIERFKESEELYNFNGVKISRRKVLRLYSTLMQNDKSDEMDALLYCITYGSMLDKNELRNIYNLVKKVCNFNNVSSFDVNTTSYVDIKNEAKAMVNGGKNG